MKAKIDKTQKNGQMRSRSNRDETINPIIRKCSKIKYKTRRDG